MLAAARQRPPAPLIQNWNERPYNDRCCAAPRTIQRRDGSPSRRRSGRDPRCAECVVLEGQTPSSSQLGSDLKPLIYSQPQPAGGIVTNADTYAMFLRKILAGTLLMKAALGTHAVCTNPSTCAQALNTPVPQTESYHYSIGHWVEDDPANGDGAFSSAGAFGFYPWIDATKSWYGIVARRDTTGTSDPGDPDSAGHGFASAECGQLIRSAWITGVAR